MKIVLDLRCLNEVQPTGVATYTRRMLRAVESAGLFSGREVVGFTSGRSENDLGFDFLNSRRHLGQSNLLLNLRVVSGLISGEKFFGPADWVWQPNPMFTPQLRAPHLVTVHDLSWKHFPDFFEAHTRRWYLNWLNNWLSKVRPNVTLLAVSEFTKADLLKFYPHWQGRVLVQAQPPPELKSFVSDRWSSQRTILFVGTLEPRKNVEALIHGFNLFRAKYPDYKLVLVGRQTKWWQKTKKSLPVCYAELNYISSVERDNLYAQAWCLLYPSWLEGYGLPPLEAMAAGCPVIASNVPGVAEAAGDGALLVDPYNGALEISAGLEALAGNQKFYTEMQTRGVNRVRELQTTFNLSVLKSLWPS